jgi:hypothetical protein
MNIIDIITYTKALNKILNVFSRKASLELIISNEGTNYDCWMDNIDDVDSIRVKIEESHLFSEQQVEEIIKKIVILSFVVKPISCLGEESTISFEKKAITLSDGTSLSISPYVSIIGE